MKKTVLVSALLLSSALPAAAQTAPSSTLRLTVDDAVKMALDKNVDLAVERLTPEIGDTRLAAGQPDEARAAWEEALAILDDLRHPGAGQVRAKLAGLGANPRT